MKDARRLFPWTNETRDKAKTIIQAVARGSGVKESIMEFSRCVVIQHVCDSDFANPVIHFMAVLGIHANRGTLREGQDASPILAGLVYCVRVISSELLLPSKGTRGPLEYQNFRDQRRTYLQDGSMGLLPALISLLAYAKKIAKNYSNIGAVFWEDGNRVMVFQGARIAMDHFRAMVENAIHEAEDLLWLTLMSTPRKTDRLELDLHDLSDDMSLCDSGHSFVYHPKNDLATAHVDVTALRLSESEHGKKMRRDGIWHPKLTADYLRQVDLFRKLLLFCVHVTGGQPARGTEILSIRLKNGCVRPRNIFLLDGYVMTVTFYNKTDSQWDSPKIIPRFLPWRVGQLLASASMSGLTNRNRPTT
ncbi:uncharacterized protein CPUR_02604 [Claviceps purpurea 20.1]|uniref:Uncharacterized protein n=1 Tax=Claviceps purpurea (strain 20.1) TaxID=1111077 RepID=M1WCK4_CLAP2|nr:uncharacterized protein CPUR_02604 [Claviceps purpurea 20.1]